MILAAPSRHAKVTLGIVAVLTVGAIFGVLRVSPEVDFVDTVPTSENVEAYRHLINELDGVRFVAIYMADAPAGGHLRDPETFDQLVAEQQDLTRFLESKFPGAFSHQLSAYEGMKAGNFMLEKLATAGNARPESYAMPEDQLRHQIVRDQILGDGSIDDVLAADGSSALMLFFFATEDNIAARHLSGEVGDALQDWNGATVTQEHAASGLLYSGNYTDQRNGHDLRIWGLVAAAAVGTAMLFILRRPAEVAMALTGMAVALTWTFGIMGWANISVSFLTLFLAPLVIGVGIDGPIHLLYRAKTVGLDAALRSVGKPIVIAGATTASGLAVIGLVPNPLFAEIGRVAAVGILFATLATFLVVGPLRSFSTRQATLPRTRGRIVDWSHWIGRRPMVAVALAGLIITGAAAAASQTRIESGSAENEFPQDDPVIVLQHRIEQEYGAFQRGYIIIEGDMRDPTALAALRQAAWDSEQLPLFREASSVVDLLLADEATDQGIVDIAAGAAQGATGTSPSEQSRLPQTPTEAEAALDRLFADPLWRTIAPFTITRDYSLAVLAITLDPWPDQETLRALSTALDALAKDVQAKLPDHVVNAGGAPMNRAAIIEQTPMNVAMASFGVAGVVGIVLAASWWRRGWGGLGMALLSVVIVLAAALILLGAIPILDSIYAILGGNNAALNDMFLLAFAITVAVGVDDLVHLAGRYWAARDAGEDAKQARGTAFADAGRAVSATTATTFIGFAALSGVYFLQSKNLAILTAVGVAGAYVLTMLLAPLAMRKGEGKRSG